MHMRVLLVLVPLCTFAQNYSISARLLPEQKAVEGRAHLWWKNDSGDPLPELRFHLYMNAFKNSRSTFLRESKGSRFRSDAARKEDWGWIDLKSIQISGGARLTYQYIHPDDDNAEDQTVIRVPLPEALKPGQAIELDMEFRTKFPHVFARTGYHGDFFLGGQWYPKIGVYERLGTRYAESAGAWNCHQFHAHTEFYADYGTYAVDLTVPSEYVVGATGAMRQRRDNNDKTTTYSFYQEKVHDFAWTAQPGFVRVERTFSADNEVPPTELGEISRRFGITHEEAQLSDVKMILLLQPEHARQTEKHFRALAAAIKYFGLWYGRYPHGTITVVDPPHGAAGAGGMEYPTFITAGTTWLVGANDGRPEEVVVHEFGHQFWQGLVGSNEFEEAWMDEGFNTYSTGKVIDKVYGRRSLPINIFGIPLSRMMRTLSFSSLEQDRAGYLLVSKTDNMARNGWEYQTDTSYSVNSYMRPALLLNTLERILGSETMDRAMRAYQQRWRYGHPAAPDFIKAVEETSGKDLKWFFNQYVFGSNEVDYSVDEAFSRPVRSAVGVVGDRTVSEEEAAKQDRDAEKANKRMFETLVTLRREGEATFPVDLVVRFDNGEVERRQWDGQYRWQRFRFVKGSRLASAEIDPEHKILLDVNWSNNSYVEKPQMTTAVKWSSNLMFWVQHLLALLATVA